MRRTVVLLTLLLSLGLIAAPALGQVDPQIYVCQSCTTAQAGHPNPITNTGAFNMGWNSPGASAGTLLVIVGVFNSTTAPTVSFNGTNFNPGGTAIYGWNGSSTGVNFSNADGTNDAYTKLGIGPAIDGGNSEQFGNWETGLSVNGIPTNTSTDFYTLYVFEITGAILPAHGSSLTLDTTAPMGSYILGYDCEVTGSPCPSGKEGATPITNAGLVVPEPASMALLGTALLGAYGLLRRKLSA